MIGHAEYIKEFQFFSRKLLPGAPAPAGADEIYATTCARVFSERTDNLTPRLIQLDLDPEAVEFFLRRHNPGLRQKIYIFFLVIETYRPGLEEWPDRDFVLRAWLRLAAAVVRTIRQFVRGWYQVRRHGLI